MRAIYYLLALCGLMALAFSFAGAQTSTPLTVAPASAHDVLEKMIARNAGLDSYEVRVHVHMHTSIPFYSPKLDGTTYFKRPGNFAVVFDSVPGYLKSVQKLFDDIGDPIGWEKDSNINLAGSEVVDGRSLLKLVMTKKIYSDQIKDTIAYVDPQSYDVVEMRWEYTNGQAIVMKQYFQTENGFSVVTRQEVDGNRRVRATGEARYETYKTNIPVDDSVFKQQ